MKRKKSNVDVRHEQIKLALKLKGILLADVAEELGVSRALVSGALLGRFRSRRVEIAIADHLGATPDALWPDRHHKEGSKQ